MAETPLITDSMSAWVAATGIRWGLDAAHRARYDLGAVPEGTWDFVSAGGNHVCALDSDGAISCWGNNNYGQPRWSPSGDRLAYVSTQDGSAQIYVRWMDTGQVAELTNVTESPGSLSWSPDGNWIAMTMHVPEPQPTFARMPARPDGAEWNAPPIVVDRLRYRGDGRGYLPRGHTHIFVMPAEGGTPRQITSGDFDHGGRLSWAPDSRSIVFSANRDNPDFDVRNSEVFEVDVESGELSQLTDRDIRIVRDAQEDMRVVGQEVPT